MVFSLIQVGFFIFHAENTLKLCSGRTIFGLGSYKYLIKRTETNDIIQVCEHEFLASYVITIFSFETNIIFFVETSTIFFLKQRL